jgi:type VI secretion system protein ImpC
MKMTEPISFAALDCKLSVFLNEEQAIPQVDTPFRIAVIGDFSGRSSCGTCAPEEMRPIMVDRDNLDDLIRKMTVEVQLSLGESGTAEPLSIKFEELDDFHPDEIFKRLGIFKNLRALRKGLTDPATFAASAAEAKYWLSLPQQDTFSFPEEPASAPVDLLDQIVSEAIAEDSAGVAKSNLCQDPVLLSFLQDIVGPDLIAADDPQKDDLIAAVDCVISKLMRAILHHPEFQEVEAAWRGIDFLIRRLDTGSDLRVYLCDMSKGEMVKDMASCANVSGTTLYKRCVLQASEKLGGEPWSLLLGCYHFSQEQTDIDALKSIAEIAHQAGAPFISGADDRLLGCELLAASPHCDEWRDVWTSVELEAWEALRSSSSATHLGLTLPDFMLRLPYGKDTDPVDTFDFEEHPSEAGHAGYLWGNSAFVCACLLGRCFSRNGWQMRNKIDHNINGLPVHVYAADVEPRVTPCSEVLLTERTVTAIMDKGIMPLLSFQGEDRVRLARFQSITTPPSALSGRWY